MSGLWENFAHDFSFGKRTWFSFGNLDNSPGYEESILVYCGNGHQAYQAEIKSLYPDMALAQEAGIRVKILNTGRDSYGWQKATMLSAEGVRFS